MKKLMIAFAATAAFVSVASADDGAWFNGGLGAGSLSGGLWTEPAEGVTKPSSSYILEDVEAQSSLLFTATESKEANSSQNLKFETSAKFAYSYDELPAVDPNAKAGVVVFENKYYVLAKKDADNNDWFDTGIAATLEDAVDVSVTITNGTDGAHALYQFGNSTAIDKLVVASGKWGAVYYSGSGEVASLVGTTISLGYPVGPGHDPIPQEVGNKWAEDHRIDPADLAKLLADTTTKYNGRTFAESCILGVGTNEDIKAEVADTEATKLDFTVKCTPIAGRAQFALAKDGVEGAKQSELAFKPDIADGVYQIVAYVDGAATSVPASQKIGVKGASVAAETVYFIGAPWADCAIADLFKKTCCTAGDMVEIYDAENDKYKSWKFNGTAWEFSVCQGDEPELIKKGQAVKYTTAAATGEQAKLYRVGDVSEVNTTPVVKGKWNLVASPMGSIAATALPLDSAAQAIQLSASGTAVAKTYLKSGGIVKYRNGYKGSWSDAKETDKVTDAFFVKPTNAESINW